MINDVCIFAYFKMIFYICFSNRKKKSIDINSIDFWFNSL